MPFKLIVGGDWGFDNGVVEIGEFHSVEEAINAASLPENNPQCEWYGSFVVEDTKVVAESNGYWGDKISAWHTCL